MDRNFLHEYPYTDFHELNLDWLMAEVKKLFIDWLNYNENWKKWREDSDKAIEDMKTYINDYFDNLNVQDEINAKIDEMASDGYFSRIADYFVVPVELTYQFMRSEGFKHYYKFTDNIDAVYGAYQGFTNTNNTFLAMRIPIEYKNNYLAGSITDKAIIIEYDSNMNELRRSGELKLYHGSTMYYSDGKIYVNANSSGTAAINKIVVVDYTTLSIINEIDLDNTSNWVFIKNDYLYTGTVNHLEKRELDGTLIESISLSGLPSSIHTVKPYEGGGYIATTNNFNMILLLDNDFNVTKTFSIYGDLMRIGELKDIAFLNGEIYIPHNDRSYIRQSDYEITETYISILKFNLSNNIKQNGLGVLSDYSNYKNGYVDTSANSKLQSGSSTAPFATVLQAVRNGCKEITLVNSDGCYIFGTNIDLYISSNNNNNIIYFDTLYNCDIKGSNITLNEGVKPNKLTGCDISLPNTTINADLHSNYCKFNFGTGQANIIEGAISDLAIPVTNKVSNNSQKYKFNSNGSTSSNIGVTALSSIGCYIVRVRITAEGAVYIANYIAVDNDSLNQYIVANTRTGGHNKLLKAYIAFTANGDGTLSAAISNAEIDNTPTTNVEIDSFKIMHLI